MALIRWGNSSFNPFEDFDSLQDDINNLFNGFRGTESQGLFDRTVSPAIDVLENSDGFTVSCDLPGVHLEDLDISVTQDVLTIKGEKKPFSTEEKRKVYKQETWHGSFQRTISLPTMVDSSQVDAQFTDGVLTIHLPKREEVKPKQIAIKAK